MGKKMKILAISGSSRKKSSTLKALNGLKRFMPNYVDYEIYNGIEKLPHFNRDIDNDTPPRDVEI